MFDRWIFITKLMNEYYYSLSELPIAETDLDATGDITGI
jgi:hypothetical protein